MTSYSNVYIGAYKQGVVMDLYELKKEQLKLAPKIVLRDDFNQLKTIAGAECVPLGTKVLACMAVCDLPSCNILDVKTYVLDNPLPYHSGFLAYRVMPALIEAYNQLKQEPDLIIVSGSGIVHPRKLGLASHLGLILNKPTIGVTKKLLAGKVENGKIILDNAVVGFEIITRKHAAPIYISPGHLVSLGSALNIISKMIIPPHKMPEPLHLAHKIAKKKAQELFYSVAMPSDSSAILSA